MIQKYTIFRDDDNDVLTIEESAVLDKVKKNMVVQDLKSEDFSIIGKEKYESKALESAASIDNQTLISSIRTNNMYPIGEYAEVIADSIARLYQSKSSQSVELIFDDQKLLR